MKDKFEDILCKQIAKEEGYLSGAVRGLTLALQLYRIHKSTSECPMCKLRKYE